MADNGAIAYKPAMAWINGGSVRSDINVGEVTMANVLEVVPFQVQQSS
jgi:2',3'-cyclic-nucleotide 2'-phosphodiesterase (5'-nucleotidase family)